MASLALSVRVVHVLGMAVLLGGGAFVWSALRDRDTPPRSLLVRFEWAFWGTLGAMLVTGVGNLAAVGAPGPGTQWGTFLTAKLLCVLGIAFVSILRTYAVLDLSDSRRSSAVAVRRLHAVTVWLLLAVVVLAEVLAHG